MALQLPSASGEPSWLACLQVRLLSCCLSVLLPCCRAIQLAGSGYLLSLQCLHRPTVLCWHSSCMHALIHQQASCTDNLAHLVHACPPTRVRPSAATTTCSLELGPCHDVCPSCTQDIQHMPCIIISSSSSLDHCVPAPAGVVQSFVGAPVDLLKIRLQLQQAMPGSPGYVGPLALLRSILRSEGVAGVWRGTTITMLRDTPSYGLYFVVYDVCCDRIKEALAGASASRPPAAVVDLDHPASVDVGRGNDDAGAGAAEWVEPAAQFLAGGLAGVLAWGSIYPLDVIKSRIQAAPASQSEYRGWWDCAVKSCREEGLGALTRGMGATLSRAFLVNAAIFAVYEACLSALCAPASPS